MTQTTIGSRNKELYIEAKQLANDGIDEDEILIQMTFLNDSFVVPLNKQELATIVANACR